MTQKVGTVIDVQEHFGYVSSPDLPGQRIWFHKSRLGWVPRNGDNVSFDLVMKDGRPQAWNMQKLPVPQGTLANAGIGADAEQRDPRPLSGWLFDWAWLGHLPTTLEDLAKLALKEPWEFGDQPQNPERPFPILYSYLHQTFARLFLERKIRINDSTTVAAFNTGLVDRRYEQVYALFRPRRDPRQQYWGLAGFCVAGESSNGKDLVRHFSPLPPPPHYFEDLRDLIYDIRGGKPECDWRHIIIDNVDRYPNEFIEDNCPPGFSLRDAVVMAADERRAYFNELRAAIEGHDRTYRALINRVKDGLELTIKRVTWNFKTAIPQYYPKVKKLQLLLPICLVSDERVDLALAVEKTSSGNYLAHTIFALDWAYRNARLICRPDSDWLDPTRITEGTEESSED